MAHNVNWITPMCWQEGYSIHLSTCRSFFFCGISFRVPILMSVEVYGLLIGIKCIFFKIPFVNLSQFSHLLCQLLKKLTQVFLGFPVVTRVNCLVNLCDQIWKAFKKHILLQYQLLGLLWKIINMVIRVLMNLTSSAAEVFCFAVCFLAWGCLVTSSYICLM